MPGDVDGHHQKFKCNYYNHSDYSFVPSKGICDFVDNFKAHAPKVINKVSSLSCLTGGLRLDCQR